MSAGAPSETVSVAAESNPPPRWLALARKVLHPAIVLPILCIVYLCITVPMLNKLLKDPYRAGRFIREDSRQYRDIGQEFADGDFSMPYVKKKPHRQPLYPLLLAPSLKFAPDSMFALGMVNIVIGLLTLVVLYFATLGLFRNALVAALMGLLFITNSFLMQQIGTMLMTEPLFILLEVPVLYGFLRYLQDRKSVWLWVASGFAGISYLARTNGLFIWMALLGALFLWDLWALLRDRTAPLGRRLGRFVGNYAIAVLVGIICTAPSWVPRVRDYGNPIFHGHIANFMWVDTYEEARSQGEHPTFSWHDYAAEHGMGDVLHRWWYGFTEVCYLTPFGLSHATQILAMLGLLVALITRNGRFLWLAFFCFVQLQPLIWTSMANHSKRVVYPGIVVFEWFFAAFALAWVAEQVWRRLAEKRALARP
ncbi:MAG: ArnT family glycosyltransferase [Chthoniobacter sp.]